MYTLEEAKIFSSNPTYHISKDVTREFAREDIIRVLESDVEVAHKRRANALWSALSSVWQKLHGRAVDRTPLTARGLPAKPGMAR
jgi:hypothetical protein